MHALAAAIAEQIAAGIAGRVATEGDTKERLAVARATLLKIRGRIDKALRLIDSDSSVTAYRMRVRNAAKARRARRSSSKAKE